MQLYFTLPSLFLSHIPTHASLERRKTFCVFLLACQSANFFFSSITGMSCSMSVFLSLSPELSTLHDCRESYWGKKAISFQHLDLIQEIPYIVSPGKETSWSNPTKFKSKVSHLLSSIKIHIEKKSQVLPAGVKTSRILINLGIKLKASIKRLRN